MPPTPDANGNVPVAGLLVPAPLVPRIVRAVRALYPSLTDGKDDDRAIRSWLKYLVTQTVAQAEAQAALAPVEDAVEATRIDYQKRAEKAREKAEKDSDAIVEAVTPSAPVEL